MKGKWDNAVALGCTLRSEAKRRLVRYELAKLQSTRGNFGFKLGKGVGGGHPLFDS